MLYVNLFGKSTQLLCNFTLSGEVKWKFKIFYDEHFFILINILDHLSVFFVG